MVRAKGSQGAGGKKDAAKQAAAWGMDISRYLAKPSGSKLGSASKQKPQEKKTPAKNRTALYDNTPLSQYPEDDDGSGLMEVVWAASPGAQRAQPDASVQQGAAGRGNQTPDDAAESSLRSQPDETCSKQSASASGGGGGGPSQEVVGEKHHAIKQIKQALIRAVMGTGSQPGTGSPGADEAALPPSQSQQQLGLAARHASQDPGQHDKEQGPRSVPSSQHAPSGPTTNDAGTCATQSTRADAAIPSQGRDSQADDDDSILQQVLAWSSREPVKTPGTSIRARMQQHGGVSAPNTGRHAWPSAGPPATSTGRPARGGVTSTARRNKRGPQPQSLQAAWGHKRRALLELLDQVDSVVTSGVASPPTRMPSVTQGQSSGVEVLSDAKPTIQQDHVPCAAGLGVDCCQNQQPAMSAAAATQHGEQQDLQLQERLASHGHASCSGVNHGDGHGAVSKQVTFMTAGVAQGSEAQAVQGPSSYMFSVQDYEDFLNSLDEDMLQAAAAPSKFSPAALQQQQQQQQGDMQAIDNKAGQEELQPAGMKPGMATTTPVHQQGAGTWPQQGCQKHSYDVPTARAEPARQPMADVHNTLNQQGVQQVVVIQAETSQEKRGKPNAACSNLPTAHATLVPPACTAVAVTNAPAAVTPAAQQEAAADIHGLPDVSIGRQVLVGDRQQVFYQVLQVELTHGARGQDDQKVLRLVSPYQGTEVWVHLHDVWVDLPVQPGDSLNLLDVELQQGPDGCMHAHCTSQQGLVVLHPDTLLSGTTIASAMDCPRKAWLSELLGGGSSAAALQGTLMHEVVQAVLCQAAESLTAQGQAAAISTEMIEQQVRLTLSSAGPKLYEVGLDADKVLAELFDKAPLIRTWATTYVQSQPGSGMELSMGPGHRGQEAQLCISGLADIEEQIWAPRYGLKGQLDASLQVQLQAPQGHAMHTGPVHSTSAAVANNVPRYKGRLSAPSTTAHGSKDGLGAMAQQQQQRHSWGPVSTRPCQQAEVQTAVVPFEFKSGRPHFSHRAQVSLYLLLMSDRYQQPCNLGLLWNLQEGPRMQAVSRAQHELAALLQHRNRLAAHLVGAVRGPPAMLHREHQCSRCHSKAACSVYHKAVDKGDCASSGLGDAWHNLTGHLTESHCQFFAHWFQLIELEESDVRARRHALWSIAGPDRQTPGTCMAQLQLTAYDGTAVSDGIQMHCYIFKQLAHNSKVHSLAGSVSKGTNISLGSGSDSSNTVWFEAGELVILSQEGQHANVARVTISTATQDEIRVLSRKRIRMVDDALHQQATLNQQQQQSEQHAADLLLPAVQGRWRLDRDEPASGSTIQRANLVELMMGPGQGLAAGPGQPGSNAARLRQLVVDLAPPGKQRMSGRFQAESGVCHPCLTQRVATGQLNPDQAAAISGILEMQDYALILGMPGTGKSSTIVEAISLLVAAGRTILLTAYTNSAVDNIGIKLAASGIDFVRVPGANTSAIHPLVRSYVPGGAHFPNALSARGFAELVGSVKVVATTCLGLRHPLLARRMFDVCILDEASQVSLPASLGPLLRARTFVLVGDHYQLPPLVANPQAAAQGYGESLFRRLCEAHPEAMVTLQRQYRMADDIMQLSSQLVYSGALRCGSDEVAQACLHLPQLAQLHTRAAGTPAWLLQALQPDARVLFLDEDGLPGCQDTTQQDAVFNRGEAELVQQLVAGLLTAGLPPGQLGVVSTYRAQVSLIQQLLTTTIGNKGHASHGGAAGREGEQAGQVDRSATGQGSGRVDGEAAGQGQGAGGGVEVLTIDKYQGRDKACIILSFVRSNAARQTGRLLMDWQRINVALTRAKHKLLMVGSSSTLSQVPLLAAMLEMLSKKGCIMKLPSTALVHGVAGGAKVA